MMVANVMHSRMLHIQTAQDIFNVHVFKGPNPSYLMSNGNTFPVNN